MARILFIDDDDELAGEVQAALGKAGHGVAHVKLAESGLELLSQQEFDVVLLDYRMERMNGIDFLKERKRREIGIPPVIFMTGKGDTDTAIQALSLGAFDYLDKAHTYAALVEQLIPLIGKALEIDWRPKPVVTAAAAPKADGPLMLGKSPPMKEIGKQIGRVASSNAPVLIRGETGTGKELVARAIHTNSPRQSRPFGAMNCTAFTESLLESELFGHEKGAFTGADKLRKGVFEHANGGTVFLDEVGHMPESMQAKLLRVLENREVKRLGSNEPIKVDVRILSATNRDLEAAIREEKFREDLFFRLNGVTILLPPLRERGDDLRLLTDYFIQKNAEANGRPGPVLHADAWAKLKAYSWPGNVRELTNVLGRAVLMCRGRQILPGDIELRAREPAAVPPSDSSEDGALAGLRQAIRWAWSTGRENVKPVLEEMLLRELLVHANKELSANKTEISDRLGIARTTVIKLFKDYQIG
jgi:two-component system nitrogen regulation response regulator GlnG